MSIYTEFLQAGLLPEFINCEQAMIVVAHPLPVALLHQVHRQMPVRHHGTGKPASRYAHVRLCSGRSPQSEQGYPEETSRLECS